MPRNNIIIAGANKSGTTSLFRYLSAHPSVCSSKVKETDFFLKQHEGPVEAIREQYVSFFEPCAGDTLLLLEASPGYLTGGKRIAKKINEVLPDARLIFLLRDPVGRILSYYLRNRQTRFHPGLAELGPVDFIAILEKAVCDRNSIARKGAERNALLQYERGCYLDYLVEYREYIARENILIVFFDDFVSNTGDVVRNIADWCGIAPEYYDAFSFHIENKTRSYRFPILQAAGSRWGMGLERVLNQAPMLRRTLRRLLTVNSEGEQNTLIDKDLKLRLYDLYEDANRHLAEYLRKEYPDLIQPRWLNNPL